MTVAVGGLAQLFAAEFALTCDDAVHLISVEIRGFKLTSRSLAKTSRLTVHLADFIY